MSSTTIAVIGSGVIGTREQQRRLLPTRLMVSFVLALWLFRGRNCGYGQVMAKLAGGLYCQQRGADLLAGKLAPGVDAGGGRRWWLPNISSLSRGRAKLGADPVRMLFEHAAGPAGADGALGVFCCGLRVVRHPENPVPPAPPLADHLKARPLCRRPTADGGCPAVVAGPGLTGG
jgi:hypothetical protein